MTLNPLLTQEHTDAIRMMAVLGTAWEPFHALWDDIGNHLQSNTPVLPSEVNDMILWLIEGARTNIGMI